ncbi:MAG: 50S ribosomal protein L17 [Parcubacteria group bacterium]|nr:50S ribosomal protein L17 [Parcubacteria group bacterium]MCR4342978.1 50S ribosomal protein L17 [Patescibacteria group bacterium]
MNHLKKGRKFGRVRNQRKALVRLLTKNFIEHEKIKTTEAKARELRPIVEKMVTKARTGSLASRRIIIAEIGEENTKKLFNEIAPKYKDRKGGYTRIIKLGSRNGDASPMAIIEFV